MLLSGLYERLPGKILSKRVVKDDIITPKTIRFLTAPEQLDAEILYLIDAASAEHLLPECSCPNGCVILCSGYLPRTVPFQISIQLISVDCGIPELYNAVADHLLQLQQHANIQEEELRRKFSDIIDRKVSSSYTIDNLCATFPYTLKSSYCVICIKSDEPQGNAAQNYTLTKELRTMFPEDNITTYDNSIVIIHSYNGFTHPPKLPTEDLSALLREYNACAGISNGIRKPSQVRVMFILAQRAMEAGKILHGAEQNVFLYDDTMLFSIVSLAASSFKEQFDSDDIILLGSPVLANLIKHDPKGKRGLAETMFQYITNGGSTAKTAEAMHMHRNTVKNRIAVIEKIAGEPLYVNGVISAKLLTTYYIMQYYEKVWNKNMVLSPLKKECETVVPMTNP